MSSQFIVRQHHASHIPYCICKLRSMASRISASIVCASAPLTSMDGSECFISSCSVDQFALWLHEQASSLSWLRTASSSTSISSCTALTFRYVGNENGALRYDWTRISSFIRDRDTDCYFSLPLAQCDLCLIRARERNISGNSCHRFTGLVTNNVSI